MDFRAINYLGSKLRILDFIEKNVNKIASPSSGICDLFAGTGCVSYRLSKNHPIICCDKQKYSEVICKALLYPLNVTEVDAVKVLDAIQGPFYQALLGVYAPLIEFEEHSINSRDVTAISSVIENGSIEISRLCDNLEDSAVIDIIRSIDSSGIDPLDCVITEYYGGVYFSYKQAVQIDAIIHAIKQVGKNDSVFIAALLSTASDIVNTVGKHFAQPLKTKDSTGRIKPLLYKTVQKDRCLDVFDVYTSWLYKYLSAEHSIHSNKVLNMDVLDCLRLLRDDVDVVYADPPYTRDHYSRYYHVLETIVEGDRPVISKMTVGGKKKFSHGLYREERYQSPFCIRSLAPGIFEEMFSICSERSKTLLLSYSPYDETKKTHPRVVTMGQLISAAQNAFKSVEVVSAGHFSHNKLNSKPHELEASDSAEVLIICSNKLL